MSVKKYIMYQALVCALLCVATVQGMKQKKLIEKMIKHNRGLLVIDKVMNYIGDNPSNERGPLEKGVHLFEFIKQDTAYHNRGWFFDTLAHNLANRITYDPSVIHECGGTTGAGLACPSPYAELLYNLLCVF